MVSYKGKYGEYTFVCQSVLSDDKDYVSLGNTLHDVVGPDVLAENDILAKFPDNTDELFGANDFLDQNQVPDPDMSLNLQYRQSWASDLWMASSEPFYGFYFPNKRRRDLIPG